MEVTTPTTAAPAAEPTPVAEAKTEAKAEPRKLKVKIDDEEREIDEQEAVKDYERRQASYKRFEEAAKIRKEAEEILSMPKKDLNKFLRDQGITLDALTDILAKRIEEESLTPEQLREREREEKLKKYEDDERKTKEKAEAEAEAKRVEEAKTTFDTKIFEALEGTNLSKDPYAVRSAALFIKSCLKNGFEPDADEIRAAIEGHVGNNYKSQVKGRKGQELVKFLGEDIVNEIRRYDLEQLRASRNQKQAEIPKAEPPKPKSTKKLDKWEIQKQVEQWAKS